MSHSWASQPHSIYQTSNNDNQPLLLGQATLRPCSGIGGQSNIAYWSALESKQSGLPLTAVASRPTQSQQGHGTYLLHSDAHDMPAFERRVKITIGCHQLPQSAGLPSHTNLLSSFAGFSTEQYQLANYGRLRIQTALRALVASEKKLADQVPHLALPNATLRLHATRHLPRAVSKGNSQVFWWL